MILRRRVVNHCPWGCRSGSRTRTLPCPLPASRWGARSISLFIRPCLLPISGGWTSRWIPFRGRAAWCWVTRGAWSWCSPIRSETAMLTPGGLGGCTSRRTLSWMIILVVAQSPKPAKFLSTIPALIRHLAGVETLVNTKIISPRVELAAYVTRILGGNWHPPGWSLDSTVTRGRSLPASSTWFFGALFVLTLSVAWMTHAGCSVGNTWPALLTFTSKESCPVSIPAPDCIS